MAFKDTWKPRIDGVDDADSSAVNEIAEAVIENEQSIKKNAENISNKQDKLTAEQLQNIDDVQNKQDSLSDEQLQNIDDVQNKVPKEEGKGLSTNDYTDEEKEKVSEIDDKADKTYVDEQLKGKVDLSTYNSQIAILGYNKANKTYVDNTFANALKGTASGVGVTITDVSPVEHTMDVKVRSKNVVTRADYKDVPYQESTYAYGSPITINIALKANKTYTVSFETPNTGALLSFVTYNKPYTIVKGSQNITADGTRKTIVIATSEDYSYNNATILQVRATSTAESSGLCSNFMIEEGDVATEYTEYVADVSGVGLEVSTDDISLPSVYYSDADGLYENIVSQHPNMVFYPLVNGVVVDVTYNRDINKAFAELEEKLTNAILSLGGNV